MDIILLAAAVLCLAYFVFLLFFGMDFAVVWILAAAFLGGLSFSWHQQKTGAWHLPVWVKIAAGIVIGICLAVFLAAEVQIAGKMGEKGQPGLDYVIVLGAQVRGETPSKALTKRLEAAYEYLEANERTKAILSGGQGDGEDITEAEAMHRYLAGRGIAPERLIKEDRSTSTEENLRFSAELAGGRDTAVGLISNNFHICRALMIARKQGYTNVCGIAAYSDPKFQVHYMVREAFALVEGKLRGKL